MCWAVLATLAALVGCRDESKTSVVDPIGERTTRFDEMGTEPPSPRVSRATQKKILAAARQLIVSSMDRSLTDATRLVIGQEPLSVESATQRGVVVGVAQRRGTSVMLRLDGADGPLFAKFDVPVVETQPCWSMGWQPEWSPVVGAGAGAGIEGAASFVWWRFEDGEKPPFLVRFDPDGVVVWRADADGSCYRGDSLLGLVGAGQRTIEYLSPSTLGEGMVPVETLQTSGTKPLLVDLLEAPGKESVVARDGVVELRSAKKKRLQRWATTLGRGSAACTHAAVHRFDGEPPHVFFEIEFTDDESCDEGWSRQEVQQTLFELRGSELIPLLSGGSASTGSEDAEMVTNVKLDVQVPMGDGRLRYVGDGRTTQSDVGGAQQFDCLPWAVDQGVDVADSSYITEEHKGRWTFELPDATRDVGAVSALIRNSQCIEARVPPGDD